MTDNTIECAGSTGLSFWHVCREERVFDREEVLGRDATSVFPTESKTEVLKSDAAKELLGSSNRFITESEVGYLLPSDA